MSVSEWIKRQKDKTKRLFYSEIPRSTLPPDLSNVSPSQDPGDQPLSSAPDLGPLGGLLLPAHGGTVTASTVSLPDPAVKPTQTASADPTLSVKSSPNNEAKHEKRTTKLAWEGLKTLLRLLEARTDAFGRLKSAFGELYQCVEIFENASQGRKDYRELGEKLDLLFQDLRPFRDSLMGPAMASSVKDLCDGIESEVKLIEEKKERNNWERHAEAMKDSEDVLGCYRRIHEHVERLMMKANLNIWKTIDEATIQRRLDRLSPSPFAAYGSAVSKAVKRGACTEGTRVLELDKLKSWARNSATEKIRWINGMAGTGKTTISYNLCAELDLDKNHQLAASFFCTRLIHECREVQFVIRTIAYQLARFSPDFRLALSSALESDPDAGTYEPKRQFEKLVAGPLMKVRHALTSDFVVVIDALDELQDDDSIAKILDAIVSAPGLPIRFLVSSRPEPEIYRRMVEQLENNPDAKLVLHELDPVKVKLDIKKYLEDELKGIPLTPEQWSRLTELCGVLFIYASTVCRQIKDGKKMGRLRQAVDMVLRLSPPKPGYNVEKALDDLYTSILEAAFQRPEINDDDRADMISVLHTVVCSQELMTTEMLAGLLDLEDAERADALLRPLCSVIHVVETGVATTLHASFSDFMFDMKRSGTAFHCMATAHHHKLTQACLQRIKSNPVQFNICGFESSYLLDKQVTDLAQRVKRAIPSALLYACRYWVLHLERSGQLAELIDPVHDFLSVRLLLWMEILNVEKYIGTGIELMQRVEKWCQKIRTSKEIFECRGTDSFSDPIARAKELAAIAADAWQFASVYVNHPISQSTPHIYTSMLPFWSSASPIFQYYIPRTLAVPRPEGSIMNQRPLPLLATWSTGQRAAPPRYSPDGDHIVTTNGNDIHIRDAWSGKMVHSLEGHTDLVSSVVFSADGLLVASGSHDGTIRIWDAKSWKAVVAIDSITEGSRKVWSVAFSENRNSLVSLMIGCIRTWSVPTGEPGITITDGDYETAIFSPDGSHIITAGSIIQFRDASTGNLIEDLGEHGGRTLSLGFSPDHSRLISVSEDSTIRVWDVETKRIILGILAGHIGRITQVIFSPNSLYIASCGDDYAIRLWDAQTGEMATDPLEGHTRAVKSIAFSPDSSRLISSSLDNTIRIWSTQHIDRAKALLEGHTDWVRSARFSSDGTLLVTASASLDRKIQLCNIKDGTNRCLDDSTKRAESLHFSCDGSQLSFGSEDKHIHVWDVQSGEQITGNRNARSEERFRPTGLDPWHLLSYDYTYQDELWEMWDYIEIGEDPFEATQSFRTFPDGSSIVFRSENQDTRMYDPRTFTRIRDPLSGRLEGLFSIVTSPNGLYLASADEAGAIQMWDAQTGQLVMGPLEGHTEPVTRILFSPDGTRMVSFSFDLTMRFWSIPENLNVLKNDIADSPQEADTTFAINSSWKLNPDGWIVNSRGELLIWVPSDLRTYLLHPENDLLISRRGSWKIDFTGTNIGPLWVNSYRTEQET
ncbi:unnamed protein product [Rhizoctonia solani]|uniref:Nephrocystin 3-like N-terminal domain-containing protein n=1 Tax=Rhizoctonia solani TaxID=456999 RepID=A0A8H3D4M4_9AGAM|nr:unnamed protein product [Rhizoctonia solani]